MDDRLKVWPTNVDQDHFRRVVESPSPATVLELTGSRSRRQCGTPIADAYLFFHRQIADWLGPDGDGLEARVEALFQPLFSYVRFATIDLDKDDDAQVIFETLNARGRPLLPSDLVKNYLFLQASRAGLDLDNLYRPTGDRSTRMVRTGARRLSLAGCAGPASTPSSSTTSPCEEARRFSHHGCTPATGNSSPESRVPGSWRS